MSGKLVEAALGILEADGWLVAQGARRRRLTVKADAWVVVSGSREVLGWFAECGKPVFALFGRRSGAGQVGRGFRDRGAAGGIRAQPDLSLVCMDDDGSQAWCKPPVSRITWKSEPLVRLLLRRAKNVSRGKADLRQGRVMANFSEGGTIGAAKDSRKPSE